MPGQGPQIVWGIRLWHKFSENLLGYLYVYASSTKVNARFRVLTAALLSIAVFRVVTLSRLANGSRRFEKVHGIKRSVQTP
jgi:hypothetical protein